MANSRPIYEIDGDDVSFQGYGKVSGTQVANMGKNTYVGDISKSNYNDKGGKTTDTKTGGTTTAKPVQQDNSYANYLAMLEAQLAAQRAAAQEAYNRNMSRIASAYDSARGSIRGNYDSTVGRLNAARDKSMGEVNSDAEKSLREAYINNMLSKKNLDQRLAAMGYNGGATETSMAQLANNYGSSRTDINEVLNRNIANLEQTYGDNLASALQSYNSAMSNLDMQKMQLEMQAENALNNASASSMSGIGSLLSMDSTYLNALAGALTNQGNYTYDNTQATNDFIAGQSTQAQPNDVANYYARYLASQGLTGQDLQAQVFNLYDQGKISQADMMQILTGNR